ncbi:hypothetical protein FZC76_21845 [Sutcliffiella horikoshii]|uniref:Uncharacterized protein n=1 Tax=Sutcliffiella horikoshii TaxID=79883 RepID=A0A5D4SEH2_9BACI|nr:hypothetical protein [Sutcliffiella horikoshii]TYS60514.1 hypothetical protein FZC76_21845 [Sutcliffiella horikoshii]
MDPKQIALKNKQRERNQRGNDFQQEIRRSWRHIPNVWRLRLKDGGGSTNAADELTITNYVNVLAELKRTAGQKFKLGMLEPNQIKGLIDFDEVTERNYGLVFISFHNVSKGLDEAYAIRLKTALQFMRKRDQLHIHMDDLRNGTVPSIAMKRIQAAEPTFDLKEVAECSKYL